MDPIDSIVEARENDIELSQQKPLDQIETADGFVSKIVTPIIGMKFDCEDSAYEFYKSYAHRVGFSVRKHWLKRNSTGQVKRRLFVVPNRGKKDLIKDVNMLNLNIQLLGLNA